MRGDRDEGARIDEANLAAEHRSETYVVNLEDQRDELRAALRQSEPLTGGPLFGLPWLDDDVWCDIAGVSLLVGYAPNTINGWISRAKPARNPFPAPELRVLYRNYWRLSTIRHWVNAGRGWVDPR